MHEGPTRYRIDVACARRLRNVLAAGLISCVGWTVFLVLVIAYPLGAQPASLSQWMQRTESRIESTVGAIGDLRVEIANLQGVVDAHTMQFAELKQQVSALQDLQLNTLLAVLGLLVTAVLGLIGVLWNLRSGWLKVNAE